jgi:hypothetical protein
MEVLQLARVSVWIIIWRKQTKTSKQSSGMQLPCHGRQGPEGLAGAQKSADSQHEFGQAEF